MRRNELHPPVPAPSRSRRVPHPAEICADDTTREGPAESNGHRSGWAFAGPRYFVWEEDLQCAQEWAGELDASFRSNARRQR